MLSAFPFRSSKVSQFLSTFPRRPVRASPSPYHYERGVLNFLMLDCSSSASRPRGLVPLLAFLPDKATRIWGVPFSILDLQNTTFPRSSIFSADLMIFNSLVQTLTCSSGYLRCLHPFAPPLSFPHLGLCVSILVNLSFLKPIYFLETPVKGLPLAFCPLCCTFFLLSFFYICLFLFQFLA